MSFLNVPGWLGGMDMKKGDPKIAFFIELPVA